jgi:zinc protease
VPHAEVEAAVDDALVAALAGDGVGDDEVERSRRRLQAEAVFVRDSLSAGAQVLGRALAIGLPVDHVEQWPGRIAAVTTAGVNAAAKAVLDPGSPVTALLRAEDADRRAAR